MSNRSRLLLVVSVVVLGAVLWFGSKAFRPPAPPDEFTVSAPFTHGNLTVFLLYGPDAERSRPVLGLDEALARKCAVVHETGDVGELTVENTSEEDDLLLLSGDIVKGGRQDRVLQSTMILPPKSGKVAVRSFCVEQSRWSKRGGEADTHFAENRAQIGGKELKKAVQLAGDQREVWANVQQQQSALSRNVGTTVNSPDSPTSLQLALENDKVQAEVAKYRDAILRKVGSPNGVIGFVTVVNGKVTGAEAFASHALFKKAWAKAVNAAAVEAVAEKTDQTFAAATVKDIRAFLAGTSDNTPPDVDETIVVSGMAPSELVQMVHSLNADPGRRDGTTGVAQGSGVLTGNANQGQGIGGLGGGGGSGRRGGGFGGLGASRSENTPPPGQPFNPFLPQPPDAGGATQVQAPPRRVLEFEKPSEDVQLIANDNLGTIVIRSKSREDIAAMKRLMNIMTPTLGNARPTPSPSPYVSGAVRNHGPDEYQQVNNSLQRQADNLRTQPSLAPAKGAVVEFREKGGGVIHKSFLPR